MICNITSCLYSICGVCNNLNEFDCEYKNYRAIGTTEECRAAVEKQIPKEPNYDGDGYAPDGTFVWDEWLCPRCGSRYEVEYDDYDYCPNCGQKLDWGE